MKCFFAGCHPDFGPPKCSGEMYEEKNYGVDGKGVMHSRYACEFHWHVLQGKMLRGRSYGNHVFEKVEGVPEDHSE